MNVDADKEFNQISKILRKEHRSTRNRIHSILYDSEFVVNVANRYPYPVVANERCGSWYVRPDDLDETCYFKSTDGHTDNWDFSTRRLNFHLLPIIAENHGIIIVDSTRRGKKIPDSQSKTIPIWCAVLNAIRENSTEGELFTPLKTVARSEHIRITQLLPSLIQKVASLDIISSEYLRSLFPKPLKPVWITPSSKVLPPLETPDQLPYIPVILVTASFRCQDGTRPMDGYLYVQGAADDHELWSSGLTPAMLWQHLDYFENKEHTETQLQEYIASIKPTAAPSTSIFDNLVQITPLLAKGKLSSMHISSFPQFDYLVVLDQAVTFKSREHNCNPKLLHLPLDSQSKKSGKDLRNRLPGIVPELVKALSDSKSVLVLCKTGTDLAVGVVLCLLCTLDNHQIDKAIIRKHLVRIIDLDKAVNPSRATLNSVNSYLMS
ncbi:hypothetical protein OGAPHI_005668 [Ogataea philodendri]|uniref:Initiator tRNA phosphoribosyl transferase n=1 Tax=Ogataea philodendri TaxID=1378263 RepID=A0A9P8T1D2_9ASCO|nr:uncharacterized protein OGAPHI_005668 [Ogataea philodendri]KAH3662416.1 hypothetical protein OGAPHI_005668 [Ogataea philodendri]